ncbi:MAG: penicillin acylase family protein, partial [Minisyncoccia bacterium]
LGRSRTFAQSMDAVSSMTFPSVNLTLAHISGDIAYGFTGLVPNRDRAQNSYLPLDGSESKSQWQGVLSQKDKPLLPNPPKRYIVTANQNVTSHLAHSLDAFGNIGAPPFRALRINQRIEEMIAKNHLLKLDELASIQLDSTSIEALELAKPLGQFCQDSAGEDKGMLEQARLIRDFDGNFTTDSLGALPFYNLMHAIVAERYQNRLKSETTSNQIDYAIKNALRKEFSGKPTAIFADIHAMGIAHYVGKMCENSYKELIKNYSSKPWRWRWGRYHYLKRQGVLADAPWIGWLFRDKPREVAGTDSAPMAEGGLPVTHGANLRFVAQMSDPPQISAILDSGNSGLFGNNNALDQMPLWHEGQRIPLETDWAKAEQNAKVKFELMDIESL